MLFFVSLHVVCICCTPHSIHNKGILYITIHSHDGSTYPVSRMNLTETVPVLLIKNWCNFLWVRSSYKLHVSSPCRLSLGTVLGFHHDRHYCVYSVLPLAHPTQLWIKEVCVFCAAFGEPYSTMNKGEVWALQRTKKSVGLRLSVLDS